MYVPGRTYFCLFFCQQSVEYPIFLYNPLYLVPRSGSLKKNLNTRVAVVPHIQLIMGCQPGKTTSSHGRHSPPPPNPPQLARGLLITGKRTKRESLTAQPPSPANPRRHMQLVLYYYYYYYILSCSKKKKKKARQKKEVDTKI